MATRKALVLVSGLFQELNSSSDKLDFAGNSTSDLSEGSNQYFTNTRARGSVSVTDSGGLGSLGYNNSTGVITYAGPSNSDVRGLVSVASGSGLTYNSSTGEFGTNAIPNAQLANSTITLGSTSMSLGATINTVIGMSEFASNKLVAGVEDAANSIELFGGSIIFEGSQANNFETSLTVTNPTDDRTITFPDATGTVALTSDIVYPVTLNNSVTLTNKTLALGSNTISGTFAQFNTAVTDATLVSTTGTETLTNKSLTAPVLTGSSASAGSIIFKEDTDNGTNSATLKGPASTADVTITLPAETGTVLTTASSIANSNLANSSLTIGSTGVALGGSATTFTGLASITSTAVVTNDSGFRIRNNSDNTKIGAFSSASITGGQTRTLTFPDADGTIATQAYVNAQITAEDLDVETDSGNFDVDLNSEALTIAGGTGIDSSGSGTTATIAIDSTVATKTGSATLTNKTIALGSNTVSGTFAQFNTAVTDATLVSTTGSETLTNKTLTSPVLNSTISGTSIKDEDNMASDSASHLATQQSIKAYVDTEIAGVPQGDITAVTAGTGLSGGGTTGAVSLAIDATVATLTGSQTLTNKTIVLGNNTVSGALADGITATTQSASDNSTKVATTAYVDNQVTAGAVNEFSDNVFRVKDNSDASKKLAFECSGISGSTTRTMTVPNSDGTISTESFATAIAVALG